MVDGKIKTTPLDRDDYSHLQQTSENIQIQIPPDCEHSQEQGVNLHSSYVHTSLSKIFTKKAAIC